MAGKVQIAISGTLLAGSDAGSGASFTLEMRLSNIKIVLTKLPAVLENILLLDKIIWYSQPLFLHLVIILELQV